MKRSITKASFIASMLLLVIAGILLYREHIQFFPKLSPGYYSGIIRGLESEPLHLFLVVHDSDVRLMESADDAQEILSQMQPKPGHEGNENIHCYPLAIKFRGEDLRLTGATDGETKYTGSLQNRLSANVGSWEFVKLQDTSEEELDTARLWLSQVVQLESAQHDKEAADSALQEIDSEISRLKEIATDNGSILATARTKEKEENQALFKAQQEGAKASKEVQRLHDQLELTRKLSPMGRMVHLSREVFSREFVTFKKALGERLPEESEE